MGENIDIKLLDESNQTENLATLSTQPRICFQNKDLYFCILNILLEKNVLCDITKQIPKGFFSKRLYQFRFSSKLKACEKTIKFPFLCAHI